MEKIKVGAVSYLNTKPLLYGVEGNEALMNRMELQLDYPAKLVHLFQQDKLDMALMPVATLLLEPDARIVSRLGITAISDVASVCIFSEVSIEDVETLLLDYQSRTSILLAQVLMKDFWKKEVTVVPAGNDFIEDIKGTTAAVIIGDRALQSLQRFAHVYDLAAIWKQYTGLPFVFAGWIARKEIAQDFIEQFDAAQEIGLNHFDEIGATYQVDYFDIPSYFKNNLYYHITPEARAGLQLFLEKVKQLQLVPQNLLKNATI